MTVVLIWREHPMGRLWVACDGRLSERLEQGHAILTDRTAKLFEIPVTLRTYIEGGEARPTPEVTRLGFTFAGSAQLAFQSYEAVVPLWSRLATGINGSMPSIGDFARHLAQFVAEYARELSAARGKLVSFECALVGKDHKTQDATGFVIELDMSEGEVTAPVRELALEALGGVEVLGGEKDQVRSHLKLMREKVPLYTGDRAPLHYIRHIAASGTRGDVGGGVQVGFVSPDGFQLYCDGQPIDNGSPPAIIRYRGFDFSKIRQVGDTWIELAGLA